MSRPTPTFETQIRGFDRAQVTDYILRVHGEVESLQDQVRVLERNVSYAETDRERLNAEIDQLRADIQRLCGPVDSVEGMSDRIARMMRVASDEARRTKLMALEEADALTRELRAEVEAARQDRAVASGALAELQNSNAAHRQEILAIAEAEAEQILQAAHSERTRLLEEADEVDRRHREMQLKLAEQDDRRRWESQQRLDEQIKSRWQQAEIQIAAIDKEARFKAVSLVAEAEREAQSIMEGLRDHVKELMNTREGVLNALAEIQTRIETTIRRDRISVVETPEVAEKA